MRFKTALFLLNFLCALLLKENLTASEPTWYTLEERKAVLDRVEIEVADVFDLSDPQEDHWLGRLANFIHINTRKRVIRQALLFREGDEVNARIIAETERLLRSLPYLIDAEIRPQVGPDGRTIALVRVHDAWSIRVGARFSDVGGDQDWRIGLGDVNLLGYGKELFLSHGKDSERTTQEIFYTDPLLFGSRWMLETAYQNLSDGDLKLFRLERDFYEYTTHWSGGFGFREQSSIETLYDRDREIYNFRFEPKEISVFVRRLLRFRDRTALRAGLEYRFFEKDYGKLNTVSAPTFPPPDLQDRRFGGILGYFAVNQDLYGSFRNLRAVSVTENYNLGWDLELSAGYFSDSMGGEEEAAYLETTVGKGYQPFDDTLLLLTAALHGRRESEGFRDVSVGCQVTGYNQSLPLQTLAAHLDLVVSYEPDPENIIYIGGEEGLQGYPSHFRAGDARWVLSLEDRFILPIDFWGIVQLGFVGFAEAGAIHSINGGGWSRIYADVGGGLRLGNLKSAFGRVILITIAFPLVRDDEIEGYQVIVGNTVRF